MDEQEQNRSAGEGDASAQAEAGGVSADAAVEVTADNVTVTHAGGDALADDALEVIVRNGSDEEQYDPADAVARTGDGDGQFEPGERATFDHGFSPGEVTVLVIDRESNTVLRRADRTVPTDEPANFTVRIDNTNSPVTEGDRLKVRATIENVGDRRATQPVTLTIDGNLNDTRDLTLDGGESEQVTLAWKTGGDAGGHTATVSSENDSANTSVQVLTPAFFNVTAESSRDGPIIDPTINNAGENADFQITVNATINNTGENADFQIINLTNGSIVGSELNLTNRNVVDFKYVGLRGGESKTVTLRCDDCVPGNYNLTVYSYDDSDTVRGNPGMARATTPGMARANLTETCLSCRPTPTRSDSRIIGRHDEQPSLT